MSTARVIKRIIVCCDGTWEDGIVMKEEQMYTNILRLARMINHEDNRFTPAIPQVVFYQSGVGSETDFYGEYVQGSKVEDAYAFIAHNYQPGDEIYLFGFSRGAYTARMVAMFIGAIGVLDRQEMDYFADIFVAYQKRGKTKDPNEIAALNKTLDRWTQHNSPGKRRADSDGDTFSIKCVGVFDTVGSLGLPEELTHRSNSPKLIFGFPDNFLGEHIERAYQALALNEMRIDFDCCKFVQSPGGRQKNQVLKQCWFSGKPADPPRKAITDLGVVMLVGSHADIGGGWQDHDLADLTLTWMAANIGDILSLDLRYLQSLPNPVAPWGEQVPHRSNVGIFSVAKIKERTVPTSLDPSTNETIHPSVLRQKSLLPAISAAVRNPQLICDLLPLEEQMKEKWPFDPTRAHETTPGAPTADPARPKAGFRNMAAHLAKVAFVQGEELASAAERKYS